MEKVPNIFISEIQIVPIKPQNGLVAFASAVINNQFFVGNVAIYTSLKSPLGFRLVFPNKKLNSGQVVDCFHPINKEAEGQVTSAIVMKYLDLMGKFQNAL